MSKAMENNSCKTEDSLLKNHPLYENKGDDLVYALQKQIEQLNLQISELKNQSQPH